MFFHGEEQTDCETADQQICDGSLSLCASCVWVVKIVMNNLGQVRLFSRVSDFWDFGNFSDLSLVSKSL